MKRANHLGTTNGAVLHKVNPFLWAQRVDSIQVNLLNGTRGGGGEEEGEGAAEAAAREKKRRRRGRRKKEKEGKYEGEDDKDEELT